MQTSFKNILVPTDFSDQGKNAIRIAIDLCRRHKAVLHLSHVIESRYITSHPESGISASSILNDVDQEARNQLYDTYQSIVKHNNIPVQLHMLKGIPYDEICRSATEMPIDLIVMGTHGTSGIRDYFIGTTAYNIIKNTTVPVLTIPSNYEKQDFKRILFPVRPNQCIKAKYELIETFLKTQSASLYIAALHLKNPKTKPASNKDELREIIDSIISRQFSCSRETYTCDNYATRVLALTGELDIDLIAINASLDYKLTQFFIDPYTQQVVNHAKVPVLSFRDCINVADEVRKDDIKKQLPYLVNGL